MSQVSVPVARMTWPLLLIFAVGSVLPTKAGLLPISTSAPSIETNTAARFMAASLSRLNRVRQHAPRSSGRDDVPLLFIEPHGAFQDAGRFVGTPNEAQDLSQVDEAVRPHVERVSRLGERDGIAGEFFGVLDVAAPRQRLRAHLPPEHLRHDVVARAGLLADLRIVLGLHVA